MLREYDAIYRNLKLGNKVTILLLLVFLIGIVLTGIALNTIISINTEKHITSEAMGMIRTITAVREYNSAQVMPELSERFETEYLPQAIPTYAVREVFENLRQDTDYENYFYKDATLNPTNPRDRADDFETNIVQRFRQNNDLQQLTGFRDTPSGKQFYIALPFAVTKPSCLECHSTPEVAPKSMIEHYGVANGFGWKLDQIVAAQIIYVPASQVFQEARQSWFAVMGIVLIVFAAAILLVNLWLKRYVVQPLKRMTQVAQSVSQGDMTAEFEQTNHDEIGSLAEAFRLIKTSLAIALDRLARFRREHRP